MKIFTGVIEVVALISCITLGYFWIKNPDGPYEPPFAIAGLVFVATEFYRRNEGKLFKREGKTLNPGELIQHRENLRKQFEKEFYKCRAEKLRKDVIIRHVNRVDSYPNIDEKGKGISAWFRAGLLDTYRKGIMVGLMFGALKVCSNGYRYTNYQCGEKGDIKVYLIGKIPYESIEAVNFDGDEYYYCPHIYCHYDHNGEPYEELLFCEEIDMDHGHPYFKEIASYESVRN